MIELGALALCVVLLIYLGYHLVVGLRQERERMRVMDEEFEQRSLEELRVDRDENE